MSKQPDLILGTRGSDLALTQAHLVKDALQGQGIPCEIRVIKTIGDKRPDLKLSEFSATIEGVHDKGIFTKELEEALLSGEIDFAVHSLKDVPTELGDSFQICATLPRAPIPDIVLTTRPELCAALAEFDQPSSPVRQEIEQGTLSHSTGYTHPFEGRTIATSSVRRAAQLRWVFPGVEVVDIRGNVPTRIGKLIANEDWDAIILARAGIQRLGFYKPGSTGFTFEESMVHTHELSPDLFPPAASQGAVAMEVLEANERAIEALGTINDETTFQQVTAERSFLAALEAGCQTPVGIHTWISKDGQLLEIETIVFDEESLQSPPRTARLTWPITEAHTAGGELLQRLRSTGK